MTPPSEELKVALPEPNTASLARSGRCVAYISGYEAGFESARDKMQAYALQAVLQERERCAALCESLAIGEFTPSTSLSAQESERIEFVTRSTAQQLAEAIRRGK